MIKALSIGCKKVKDHVSLRNKWVYFYLPWISVGEKQIIFEKMKDVKAVSQFTHLQRWEGRVIESDIIVVDHEDFHLKTKTNWKEPQEKKRLSKEKTKLKGSWSPSALREEE